MADELSLEQIQEWLAKIDVMTHVDMARFHRFAPSGHPVFDTRYPLHDAFEHRFKRLGGMTTEVSKDIGWDR